MHLGEVLGWKKKMAMIMLMMVTRVDRVGNFFWGEYILSALFLCIGIVVICYCNVYLCIGKGVEMK